jgi:hypothetical protein
LRFASSRLIVIGIQGDAFHFWSNKESACQHYERTGRRVRA